MPVCQYIYKGETITKNMITPKRITNVYAWYKEAQKAIKEMPNATFDMFNDNDWMIFQADTDPKWVKFDLHRTNGERAYIVILRKP